MRSESVRVAVLLSLAAVACNDGGVRAPALMVTRDTIGDTVIVRTESGSGWAETRQLVAQATFGVLEGADEYMFGSVAALAVTPDERIFVLDQQVPAVRLYAPDGSFIRNVGRVGEGPGEYERPDAGLAFLPPDRLVLRDPGTGKILVFDGDGEHVTDWRLPYGGGFSSSTGFYQDTAGHLLTYTVTNLGAPVTEWEYGLIRYRPEGTVRDTLDYPDWDFEPWVVSGQSENSSSSSSVPFSPAREVSFSPEGYFVGGLSTDYRIDLLGPDSRVTRIERLVEPVPVNPDEARIRRRRIEDNFKDRFEGWSWNGPDIPDFKPAFGSIFVGEDARIWVVAHTESVRYMSAADVADEERDTDRIVNPYRSPVEFDVFEPTGEYLGRVWTPEGFSLSPRPVFRGDHVWAVTRDEFGVERINRFGIAAVTAEAADSD